MRLLLAAIPILVLQFGSAQGVFGSGSWELVRIGTTAVTVQNTPTISFEARRLKLFLGCNNGGAPYTRTGRSLRIGPIVSTRKSCGAQLDRLESQFSSALQKVAGYSISADGGNTLYMGLIGPGVILRFTPKP